MQNKLSFYRITIPIFTRGLEAVLRLLKKAEDFTKEKESSAEDLLMARLYPDMKNFIEQIGYAYFLPLEVMENISGISGPKMSYSEKTFAELNESVQAALEYLKKIEERDVNGKEEKLVPYFWDKEKKVPALEYVERVSIPDFHFHVVTAYGILRSRGVPIGKTDYISEM